jgi:acyl carrier protein
MDGTDPRTRIRQFVVESLGVPDLRDSDDVFEIGHATSLFSVQLVMFIEEELGVPLDDEDLQRENFCTISAISEMIDRKLDTH